MNKEPRIGGSMKSLVSLTLSVVFASSAFGGEKIALLFGGGTKPMEREFNLFAFTEEAIKFVKFAQERNYNIVGAYGDGRTNIKVNALLKSPLPLFSNEAFINQIDSVIQKINDGKVERIIVEVSSHGYLRSAGELTHSVRAGMPRDTTISLDHLGLLKEAALSKGVKVFIFDTSCYSGESIVLANQNTCVVTSSNSFTESLIGKSKYFSSFTLSFWDELEKNPSIEETWLKARKENLETQLPRISTKIDQLLRAPDDRYFSTSPVTTGPELDALSRRSSIFWRNEFLNLSSKSIPIYEMGHEDKPVSLSNYFDRMDKLLSINPSRERQEYLDLENTYLNPGQNISFGDCMEVLDKKDPLREDEKKLLEFCQSPEVKKFLDVNIPKFKADEALLYESGFYPLLANVPALERDSYDIMYRLKLNEPQSSELCREFQF